MNTIKLFIITCLLSLPTFAFATEFSNGQSVTLSGNSASSQFHSVAIPANADNLHIELAGGSGDADLYVRYNAAPTSSTYDCRPYINGNDEVCEFASPNTGTYHILVYGYTSFTNTTLSVSYTLSGSAPTPIPNPSGATIDVVTYNVEWLGNPTTAGYNGTRTQQINAAANDIINGGGEIYALQEIGGSSALNDLLTSLNSNDTVNSWNGNISQPTASQSLAFVYKTNVVTSANFQTILTNQDSYNFASRYPYLMTATINVNGISKSLNLINLHLKCCTGSTNASRRAGAMATLVSELNSNYRIANMMVLGDLNVADEGGANGEIANWGFYADRDNDGQADYSHAAGSLTDEPYVATNPDSDIDHILISNELSAAWYGVGASIRNQYLTTTVSDHSPVKTTLDVSLIGSTTNPIPTPNPTSAPNPGLSGISVTSALAQSVGSSLTVVAIIVEEFNGVYALKIRDVNDASKTLVVKLESSQRNTWSPNLNTSVIGKTIQVIGKRDTYSNLPSLEYVTSIQE